MSLPALYALAQSLHCEPELYANDLLPFAQQGFAITKALAVRDVASFCRVTTRNQAQHDLAIDASVASDADIASSERRESWGRSYHPDAAIRLDSFLKDPELSRLQLNTIGRARAYLSRKAPPALPMQDSPIAFTRDASPASLPAGRARSAMEAALCHQVVVGQECAAALDSVITRSMPVKGPGGFSYTQPQLYREFLNDTTYTDGLRRAALKVLDKAASGASSGDLFSDLRASFAESGFSAERADDATWKTLALLATGGPNTGRRTLHMRAAPEVFSTKVSLSVLSTLAPYLDSLSIASGHPYSYPPDVHTTCDTGKPYHFWLTAYLARSLVREGTSPRAAAAAAFLGEKGYQMMSESETRDPRQPFREPFLAAYSNSVRMDLAVASAGAAYGAGAEAPDIDEGVRRVVLASEPLPRLGSREASLLFDVPPAFGLAWEHLMAPDEAFHLFESQLK